MDISGLFHEYFRDISGIFQGYFSNIPVIFQEYISSSEKDFRNVGTLGTGQRQTACWRDGKT